ncbi:uncharacterized protein LOC144170373 isoform X2 [Haemaphysalis longicornis]
MAAVTASSMLEFVRRIFRERRDHGMLTIRQLRTLYTDELKVKHLSSENREVFASIVTTVFKEFEDVADSKDKSSQEVKLSADKSVVASEVASPVCATTPPPQNGNCAVDGDSPIKCPNARNVQRIVDSSSDSDDDDVIRAVKETLGVRTHRRTEPKQTCVPGHAASAVSTHNNTSSAGANNACFLNSNSSDSLSHTLPKVPTSASSPRGDSSSSSFSVVSSIAASASDGVPVKDPSSSGDASNNAGKTSAVCGAIPTVLFPKVSVDKAEVLCGGEASDSSDSEGKLMIAESPMSAESPRRPSSDGEGSARVGEQAAGTRRHSLPETKNSKAVTSPSEGPKTPTRESNGKEHKSMDDMPLFTLKLTKTKTGGWIMVRPKSEESDVGDETTPQKPAAPRRKRICAPRKTKEKIPEHARGIFDSSDDEPLSELLNRQPNKKKPIGPLPPPPPPPVAAEHPSLSDLEQKLNRVQKRRKKPADGFPPPSKKRKPAAKPASAEDPAVAKLKRCISTAGLRVRYVQLLEETDTVDQKVEKLMKVLRDAGLKGNATLANCKKLRQQREEESEVRSLDKSNIVAIPQDGATKRTTRSAAVSAVGVSAGEPTSQDGLEKPCKVFSRLKDIIDSEDSD